MRLDDLIQGWSAQQRLTAAEARDVRGRILQSESDLEADRLWDLLAPVTNLLDGKRSLSEMLGRVYGV